MIIAYIIHITSWAIPYQRKHSLQKQVRRLYFVVACLTWLMGVDAKNDSYLRKATTVILWLPNSGVNPMTTIVRETDIHQLHVWNKPHVKCGAGLANEVGKGGPGPLNLTYPH